MKRYCRCGISIAIISTLHTDGVRMLGLDEAVDWRVTDGMLTVRLPERMPVSPSHVLALGHGLRPAG